jgi:hypothetical protein
MTEDRPTTTVPQIRTALVAAMEHERDRRRQNEGVYPDDSRNSASVLALALAARYVAPLPDDHPKLVTLAAVADGWGFVKPNLTPLPEDAQVSQFGFRDGPPITEKDVERLLDIIVSALASGQFELDGNTRTDRA